MAEVENQGPRIKGALWAVTVLPMIFGGLRIYCKGRFKAIVGWDDAVLIFSWILLAIYTIITHVCVDQGIGKHAVDIDPEVLVPALRNVYIGEFIIIIGCSLSKTSFAITLLRTVTRPWQKILVWWIIISMNVYMFLTAILYFAQCSPVAKLWDLQGLAEVGSCWDPMFMTKFAMGAGAYSAAMDFLLAFLPWTFLMKLQMKKREKFGIAIAMSLGVFAGATSIVKTTYLPNIALQQDFTYYCADLLIWAGVETGVTLIAASIPFLRPLVRAVSSYGRSNGDSTDAFTNNKGTGHSRQRSSMLGGKKQGFRPMQDDLEMNKWGNASVADAGSDVTGISTDSHRPMNGIKQTNEVTVTYDKADKI